MGPKLLSGRLALERLKDQSAGRPIDTSDNLGRWAKRHPHTRQDKFIGTENISTPKAAWSAARHTDKSQKPMERRQRSGGKKVAPVQSTRLSSKVSAKVVTQGKPGVRHGSRQSKADDANEDEDVVEDERDDIMEAENAEESLHLRVQLGDHRRGLADTIGFRRSANAPAVLIKSPATFMVLDSQSSAKLPNLSPQPVGIARMSLARNRDISLKKRRQALDLVGGMVGSQPGTTPSLGA
jgi:hypothetical protein